MSACSIVSLPTRKDARGSLAFAEIGAQLPFSALRIFHLYDLRVGVARGGHAHRRCHQFLIAMAGSFRITTTGRNGAVDWQLDSPARGLHVPPGQWVDLVPTLPSSVLVVLASEKYDEADYIRDWDAFEALANSPAS